MRKSSSQIMQMSVLRWVAGRQLSTFQFETAVLNILKDKKNLRKDFQFFKGSYKKRRHGKYRFINEILYTWHGKCTSANVYPDCPLLQEEAMEIKRRLDKEEFAGFTASNEQLGSRKQT